MYAPNSSSANLPLRQPLHIVHNRRKTKKLRNHESSASLVIDTTFGKNFNLNIFMNFGMREKKKDSSHNIFHDIILSKTFLIIHI